MKIFLNAIFCLCVVCSTLCFAESGAGRMNNFPPNSAVSKINAKKQFSNIFRKVKNGFKRLFGIPVYACILINSPAGVTTLRLSRTVVYRTCENKSCSDTTVKIDVSLETFDAENDVLTYNYEISAGKIVGRGAKVVWDLSDVKIGTYTINVWVDDGCGNCGKNMSQEIKVVE